jgi:PTH1 family peptidyl-tRNA hydrolase
MSIIEALGTEEFARLRLGVGGGHPGADIAHHVLSKFSGAARTQAREIVDCAADAIECYLSDGLAEAMNRFNTQRPVTTEPPSGANATPDTPRPKGDPE